MKFATFLMTTLLGLSAFASPFQYTCQSNLPSPIRKYVNLTFEYNDTNTVMEFYNKTLFGNPKDVLSVSAKLSYQHYSNGWGDYAVYYFSSEGVLQGELKSNTLSLVTPQGQRVEYYCDTHLSR